MWKDQSASFPTKIAWSWSAIDHVQSPADWHKNRAGARHTLPVYLAESDIQNNFKNRTKYKITSTTSTRSHANKNKHANDNLDNIWTEFVLSEHWIWHFRAPRFQHFLGQHAPRPPPSGWPLQLAWFVGDLKKPHHFIYLSWTVFLC